MKERRSVFALAFGFLLLGVCGSAAAAPKPKPDLLDVAVREASAYLNGKVQKGSKAVFLNVASVYPDLSDYILSVLSENAVNDGVFGVVDRNQLDAIRAELDFQYSGEVSDKSAQEIGQMLGAQSIVSGAVKKLGKLYRLEVKAISVQTAAVQGQWSKNINDTALLAALTAKQSAAVAAAPAARPASAGAPAASGAAPAAPAQPAAPAAPAAPALPAYKIGDAGPAGGLIFLDKGNNNGGWRYLEAAPVDAESRAVWSVRNTNVDNTQEGLGYGKRNTQLIVDTFSKTSGEWDTAAQKCDDLVYNGFDDWFLPSKAELDQMYGNLKRRNLGDFKNEWYSSSSTKGSAVWYANNICKQNFGNGEMSDQSNKDNIAYVRPVRQVPGP